MLEKILNRTVLSDYNLSVDSIEGTLVGTLRVRNLKFNDAILIKAFDLDWSAFRLMRKHLDIKSIKFGSIDLNASQHFVNSLANTQSKESNSSSENPLQSWRIDVGEIGIDVFYNQYKASLSGDIQDALASLAIEAQTPEIEKIILQHSKVDLKTFTYSGLVHLEGIEAIENQYRHLVEGLNLSFGGNLNFVDITLDSHYIQGTIASKDIDHTLVNIYTKQAIPLEGIVPSELNASKLDVALLASFNLKNITPLNASLSMGSNIVNIHNDIEYKKQFKLHSQMHFPKNTLLHKYDKNLHLDKLGAIEVHAIMDEEKRIEAKVESSLIQSSLALNAKSLDGWVDIASQKIGFKGDIDKKLMVDINISSLKKMVKKLTKIYTIELPKLKGAINSNLIITNKKEIDLKIASPKISIDKNKIKDIALHLNSNLERYTLKSYQLEIEKQKIFATKPSTVILKEGLLSINKVWLNDAMEIEGTYHLKTQKGKIEVHSEAMPIHHPKYIKMNLISNLSISLNPKQTDIHGAIEIDGGEIYYKADHSMKLGLDKDIIIVQKKKKSAPKELSLDLTITTQKPLIYKTKDANIQAHSNLHLTKGVGGEIKLNGAIEFVDWSSYYMLQNKKIQLYKSSAINFKGDPTKPNLDIKAYYNGDGVEIMIDVLGTPSAPVISFSSNPYMRREAILSMLLFDTSAGANANKSEDLQYLLGGALAKSFLSNLGLRVEHFVITDSKLEIGKKIGDKITVIYLGDEVSSVKVVYDHSKNIEADFIINRESSSMDIFYKGEL